MRAGQGVGGGGDGGGQSWRSSGEHRSGSPPSCCLQAHDTEAVPVGDFVLSAVEVSRRLAGLRPVLCRWCYGCLAVPTPRLRKHHLRLRCRPPTHQQEALANPETTAICHLILDTATDLPDWRPATRPTHAAAVLLRCAAEQPRLAPKVSGRLGVRLFTRRAGLALSLQPHPTPNCPHLSLCQVAAAFHLTADQLTEAQQGGLLDAISSLLDASATSASGVGLLLHFGAPLQVGGGWVGRVMGVRGPAALWGPAATVWWVGGTGWVERDCAEAEGTLSPSTRSHLPPARTCRPTPPRTRACTPLTHFCRRTSTWRRCLRTW